MGWIVAAAGMVAFAEPVPFAIETGCAGTRIAARFGSNVTGLGAALRIGVLTKPAGLRGWTTSSLKHLPPKTPRTEQKDIGIHAQQETW